MHCTLCQSNHSKPCIHSPCMHQGACLRNMHTLRLSFTRRHYSPSIYQHIWKELRAAVDGSSLRVQFGCTNKKADKQTSNSRHVCYIPYLFSNHGRYRPPYFSSFWRTRQLYDLDLTVQSMRATAHLLVQMEYSKRVPDAVIMGEPSQKQTTPFWVTHSPNQASF